MIDRWSRILATFLLVIQGGLALGAGRTICLPLSMMPSPAGSTNTHHDHGHDHGSHHHHGNTSHHHPLAWCDESSEEVPNHVHLPLPDVDLFAHPGPQSNLTLIARPTTVNLASGATTQPSENVLQPQDVPGVMLGSDQLTARATTIMMV